MPLPVVLHKKIVDFLTSLPNIDNVDGQRAFIKGAALDVQLQRQITFPGSSGQFIELLVPQLVQYGELEDGRNALEAVLETAKNYVGQGGRRDCEKLLQGIHTLSHIEKPHYLPSNKSVSPDTFGLPSNQPTMSEKTIPQGAPRQHFSLLNSFIFVLVLMTVIVGLRYLSHNQQIDFVLTESYLMIGATVMILFSLTVRFYLIHAQKFNQEYPALSNREFHWLIWPAIGANYVFDRMFGKRPVRFILTKHSLEELRNNNAVLASELKNLQDIGYSHDIFFNNAIEAKIGKQRAEKYKALILHHTEQRMRIRDLFTWRSIGTTLLVSMLANSICVILILLSFPEDVPAFEPGLLQILGLSYIAFIGFNFLGDLVSVNFTRHVVAKIADGRCNFLYYLLVDGLGILLGYLVTLSPSLIITTYCWITSDPLNKWIYTGFLGNALIPFFLFIFMTTKMSLFFAVFAVIAVFSITIPTVLYLSLMIFCYLGYRAYSMIWKRKGLSAKLEGAFQLLTSFGILLLVAAVLAELVRMVLI